MVVSSFQMDQTSPPKGQREKKLTSRILNPTCLERRTYLTSSVHKYHFAKKSAHNFIAALRSFCTIGPTLDLSIRICNPPAAGENQTPKRFCLVALSTFHHKRQAQTSN